MATEALAAVFPNAGPPGEIGVTDVDPHASRIAQAGATDIQDFSQVTNVPFRKRFQTEDAAVLSIPQIRGAFVRLVTSLLPRAVDLPVVLLTVASLAPVRGTRDD